MIQDGLRNPFSGKQMFEEATEVGDELEMTRADLDKWALRSHERALAATDDGRLAEEIVPVTITGRKGDTVVEVDEAPRRGARLEALAKLPGPDRQGRLPHGRQLARRQRRRRRARARLSEDWAERNGKDILATIVAQAAVADEFAYLARTPANAAMKALDKAGLQPGDIDLWEINEAFSSVALNSRPDARHRRGARERQRRRGRARPPDRRLRRPHHRRARARAAPARRRLRLRGDLLRRRPGRRVIVSTSAKRCERRDPSGARDRHILPPPPGGRSDPPRGRDAAPRSSTSTAR